jgi:hypothetical protein
MFDVASDPVSLVRDSIGPVGAEMAEAEDVVAAVHDLENQVIEPVKKALVNQGSVSSSIIIFYL